MAKYSMKVASDDAAWLLARSQEIPSSEPRSFPRCGSHLAAALRVVEAHREQRAAYTLYTEIADHFGSVDDPVFKAAVDRLNAADAALDTALSEWED